MRGPDPFKATRYIQQLDEARCNGDWEAVPELVRKVRKHAPERVCLTLAAQSSYNVQQALKHRSSTGKDEQIKALASLVTPLIGVIDAERTYPEDEFQAQVALGWVYWALGDVGLAEKQLPANIDHYFSELDGTNKVSSGWTQVCALKAIYIKGASLAKSGSPGDALGVFESAIPIISRTAPQLNSFAELRKWTELVLTKFCFLTSHAIKNNMSPWLESETLTAFRAWADFWERQAASSATVAGGQVSEADISRRQVWREYYATLSYILQNDLPYPTTALATSYNDHALRHTQRGELTRVEGQYEALLLKEVQFPKAEEGSEEVEEWVDHVMKNWRVFCGGSWDEQTLGAGGRDGLSRGVLDILYRAATKTFHSTQVLRHLFTVHLAVADFDLAFKAFDTYFDIVNKGKQRVDKTGEPVRGLDSNEEVLIAASKCMRALCRFGGLAGAEKAKNLAHFFESWLEKYGPPHSHEDAANGSGNQKLIENGHVIENNTVSPHVYAHAWRSIGISNAQWARLTHDEKSRPEFQLKAVTNLRKALSPEYGCVEDVDTLFALALVLAERRQLGEALRTVGAALAPQRNADRNRPYHSDSYSGDFARERSLVPLWHLLALLLSAKEEFPEASRACEGAFKQFGDLKILFGETEGNGTYQSEHLNDIHEKGGPKAIIDDMDDFEKEAILEVKITQLVLIEIQDGPDVAVNGTEELLSLYSRLFADSQAAISSLSSPKTPQQQSPGTATGTLRSVKGSIFGRSRRSTRQAPGAPTVDSSPTEKSSVASRPQTSQTTPSSSGAPTIQVTRENGESAKLSRRSQHGSFKKKAASIYGDTLSRKKSQVSTRNRSSSAQKAPQNQVGVAVSADISEGQASHNTPGARFPPAQARRHRVGILVKLWLLIAGFYRRAEQYEDAKAAIDAACELVEGLETDILHDPASSVAIDDAGWGIGKCVGELWADVWAERGHVALANQTPHVALTQFEAALSHFPNHPASIIALSSLLLDIHAETLLPPPPLPELVIASPPSPPHSIPHLPTRHLPTPPRPLGLPVPSYPPPTTIAPAATTPYLERLAARDRAHGLLDRLTKMGRGWSDSEAWFGLARAYEEAGMEERAMGVLWWCVQLEEGRGVRGWGCVGGW